MTPVFKITIDLVICSVFVECRKDKVFSVIYARFVSRLMSRRLFTILCSLRSVSDIVSCFGLRADTSTLMGYCVTAVKFLYIG